VTGYVSWYIRLLKLNSQGIMLNKDRIIAVIPCKLRFLPTDHIEGWYFVLACFSLSDLLASREVLLSLFQPQDEILVLLMTLHFHYGLGIMKPRTTYWELCHSVNFSVYHFLAEIVSILLERAEGRDWDCFLIFIFLELKESSLTIIYTCYCVLQQNTI
jgi:hypothetical protein